MLFEAMPLITKYLYKLLFVNSIPGTRQSGLLPNHIYGPQNGTLSLRWGRGKDNNQRWWNRLQHLWLSQ